ncbi:hypothetical protein HMN09_01206700 [Mycena chlorophos]|uniref:Uncharacterized protein n=1 Tax=Mycena chlorophos TaxID=658473 RepID=A0A8H6S5R3_MYCCL|nr:hypothetical protein HMN09_01206700 [Mycena chlorophos]
MKGSKGLGGGIRITSRRRPYERPVGGRKVTTLSAVRAAEKVREERVAAALQAEATIRREREAAGMEQGPDNMELDGESDTEMQDFSFLGGDIDMPHAPVVQPAQVELFHFIMAQHRRGYRRNQRTRQRDTMRRFEAQMDPIADGMEDWDYLVEQEGPDAVYNPPEGVPVRYKKVYVVDIFQEGFREENLTDKARGIFKETGLFASFCRHSVTLVLVDMIESGESAKYGLSITCHLLAVLGKHVLGYDIGCKFEQWVYEHPLVCKLAEEKGFSAVVGAFHITGHLRQCQLRNMPLYRDGMGLDAVENAENIFSKSNALADNFDALANIVSLIHNKYRRALEVLSKEEDLLDYMNTNNITERSLEMGVLEDFDLLRLGREDIRDAAWAQPGARVAMDLHFRLLRAHEEILRCNVEIKQFSTWMKEEREFLVYQELAWYQRDGMQGLSRFGSTGCYKEGDIEPGVGVCEIRRSVRDAPVTLDADQEAEIVQALQQVAQEEEQDGGDGTGAQDDEDHEDEEEYAYFAHAALMAWTDEEQGHVDEAE